MKIKDAIADEIREFIISNVNQEEVNDDLDIFSSGLLSSLFAIELMTFVEKKFQIKVTMDDLDMSNFSTIRNITEYVARKRSEG